MSCKVVFENKLWDPTIMAPKNDISSAYVVAVTFYNNVFQCSSGINSAASSQQPTYEYCIHGSMVAETKIIQKSTTASRSTKSKKTTTKNKESKKGAKVKKPQIITAYQHDINQQ
eukprot:15343865-Ditylum_brightwellii.AAC.1